MRAICRGELSVTIAHVMAKYAGEAGGSDRYELEMVSLFPCCSVKPDRKKNKLVGYVFVFDNLEFKRTIRGKILL